MHDSRLVHVQLTRVASEASLDALHLALESFWGQAPPHQALSSRWKIEFNMAVAEVAANVIEHAHVHATPGMYTVTLSLYRDSVTAVIADNGRPYVEAAEEQDPLAEGGRGLRLARMALDRLEYLRQGDKNLWTLEKRYAPQA